MKYYVFLIISWPYFVMCTERATTTRLITKKKIIMNLPTRKKTTKVDNARESMRQTIQMQNTQTWLMTRTAHSSRNGAFHPVHIIRRSRFRPRLLFVRQVSFESRQMPHKSYGLKCTKRERHTHKKSDHKNVFGKTFSAHDK